MNMIPRSLLSSYRRVVADPEYGPGLAAIVKKITGRPGYSLGGRCYKRIPAGLDPVPESAPLLLHGGLYAGWEGRIPAELHSPALLDFCLEKFKVIKPLHEWLVLMAAGGLQ